MRPALIVAICCFIVVVGGVLIRLSSPTATAPGNWRSLGDLQNAVSAPVPAFPLKVSANRRYLADQKGQPFLVVGDTAWSLIVQLPSADIRHYLLDRQKKGFNSVIVNLLERKFCANPPKTIMGLAPFLIPGDFGRPNPAYFDFAHQVVKQANDLGITVWLAPAYLGYRGGDEGWYSELKACGPTTLREYGRFLGQRFRDLPNIIWLMGGDYSPPEADRWTVTAIAEGIRVQAPEQLMTAHGAPGEVALHDLGQPSWIDVSAAYGREDQLLKLMRADYRRTPARPFVLIEGTYENEHDAPPAAIRRQAYWAMLAGACGQFFGNCPIWHFDGPGTFTPKTTWKKAVDGQGTWDMIRLRNVFASLSWQELTPDFDHQVVVHGRGEELETIVAALHRERKLALAYVPSTGLAPRTLTIDLKALAGPVSARWFNPTNGRFQAVDGSPFPNRGMQQIESPGDNGAAANDWLLMLQAD
jgi:hypothetical protein